MNLDSSKLKKLIKLHESSILSNLNKKQIKKISFLCNKNKYKALDKKKEITLRANDYHGVYIDLPISLEWSFRKPVSNKITLENLDEVLKIINKYKS